MSLSPAPTLTDAMQRQSVALGVLAALAFPVVSTGADASAKLVAGRYDAPQLFFVSGAIICILSLAAMQPVGIRISLKTRYPWVMAMRSALTVACVTCYFYAFRLLDFVEVFIFIGLTPIGVALLSAPVLREPLALRAWAAVVMGAAAVPLLLPHGVGAISAGYWIALLACATGAGSIVCARYIGRRERHSALAMVFYPNLALFIVAGAALPFVFRPMNPGDFLLCLSYAALLFLGRWLSVLALQRLSAHTVSSLGNLQFVWMLLVGQVVFAELPGINVYLGAAAVIAAGLYLIYDSARRAH